MIPIPPSLALLRRFWWALPLIAAAIWIAMLKAEIRSKARDIAALQTRIERLAADLAQCRANTATLNASILRQNAAVSALRREGEARVAELDRVAQRARQEAESAAARARRIMAARSTGDQCADARALILESVR